MFMRTFIALQQTRQYTSKFPLLWFPSISYSTKQQITKVFYNRYKKWFNL